MMRLPFLDRRQLHIVAKEMTQVMVVAIRQAHFDSLKRELHRSTDPGTGINLLIAIDTTVHHHMTRGAKRVTTTDIIQHLQQMTTITPSSQEPPRLITETTPLMSVEQQTEILAKRTVGGDGSQPVLYL